MIDFYLSIVHDLYLSLVNWLSSHIIVFLVRIAVLFGATWAIEGMVNRELGYHIEFRPMLIFMIVALVTIRVWMPWSTSTRDG